MTTIHQFPKEIIKKIAVEHLETLEDFEAFREACSEWWSTTKGVKFCPRKNTQLPFLMLADPPNSSYRRLYNLSTHGYRKIDLPQLDDGDDDDRRMFFSSKGCLISVSMRDRNITLFDPFFGTVIKLPSVPLESLDYYPEHGWDDNTCLIYFAKFVISARPSSSGCCSDDFVVAAMLDKEEELAFWKPGQREWIRVVADFHTSWVFDGCFYRGEFYAINCDREVMVFGSDFTKQKPKKIADLSGIIPVASRLYMVVVENALLVVYRERFEDPSQGVREGEYWTGCFKVFELNVDNGEGKEINELGNRAIFVGYNSTFVVEASLNNCSCKANCIYFTDDYGDMFRTQIEEGGGSDMGIYSLSQRKVIEQVYKGPSQFCKVTPPTWVELPYY